MNKFSRKTVTVMMDKIERRQFNLSELPSKIIDLIANSNSFRLS